jgi:hypothetical protein
MKKSLFILLLLLLFCLVLLLFQACAGDDDNDDDNDDDDLHPPYIFDAYWDPDPVRWIDQENAWMSLIVFFVCDLDNDLEGGAIYAYLHGTLELIWDEPVYWIDFFEPEDDCEAPPHVGAEKVFAETEEPPGWNMDYCVDLIVSDGTGLFSNMETNLCVYVP